MTNWLTGYAYRKAITIDAALVDADLSCFPVLVSLVNDSAIGIHALASGYDLRFTSYDGSTLLNYETESFAIGGGVCNALLWVKVPALSSSSDTVIYLYYGKSNATDGQNINGVWDDGGSNNFKGVWHLKETGTGAANDYKDSTQYANNSTNATDEPTRTTGKIGYGQVFDGIGQNIYAGTNSSLAVQSNTLSGWIKLHEYSTVNTRIIASKSDSIVNSGVEWGVNENGDLRVAYNDGGIQGWYSVPSVVSLDTDYYISFVWAPGTLKIYTNGSQSGNDITTTTGTIVYSSDFFRIGNQTQNMPWSGTLDEIRVSNTARSPGWVSAEYNNQNSPSSFYSVGSEEPYFIQKTFTSSNDIQLSKIFTATNDLLLYKPFSNSNDIGMNKSFASLNDIQLSKIFTATNDLLLYKSFSNSNDIGINKLLTSSNDIQLQNIFASANDIILYRSFSNSNDIQLSGVFSNYNDVQISKTFESTSAILAALLTKLFSSDNDIHTAQAFSSSNDIQLQNIFASANDIILYRSFSNSNDIQLSGVFSNYNDVQISKTFDSTNAILEALLTKLFSSDNDIHTAQAFSSSNDIQLSKLFSSSSDILAILSKLFSSSNDIQISKAFSSDNNIKIYKLFSSSNDIITVITTTRLNHPLTLVISQNERTLVIFNNSRAVTIEQ